MLRALTSPSPLNWPTLLDRLEEDLRHPQSERDELAWCELLSHVRKCSRVAAHQFGLRDEYEEIVQELMVRLHTTDTLRRVRLAGAPTGYLFAMARNQAREILRQQHRETRLGPAPPSVGHNEPEPVGSETALRRELRRLTRDERELLRFRFWTGLPIAEIARRKQMSYSAVAVRIFRLLRRLRSRLADAQQEQSSSSNI